MSAPDPAPIDVTDPLLVQFVYQHDLRSRFQHAIEDSLGALMEIDDPEVAVSTVRSILDFAIDPIAIENWMAEGRPLPWIDQQVGPAAEELTRAVLAAFEAQQAEVEES